MKTNKNCIIALLTVSSVMSFGQTRLPVIEFSNPYATDLPLDKRYINENFHDYDEIDGSPYLNSDFVNGTFYVKDTLAIKHPIRYNLYTDQMEYKSEGINYYVGSPQSLSRIVLGESVFIYLPFIEKGGYFELFEPGKCKLVQKRKVVFKHSETKPIVGIIRSSYERRPDEFYLIINQNQAFRIVNMNSVINALKDQKPKIETFIKQEKIRNTKKENLIKIAKYYNSL